MAKRKASAASISSDPETIDILRAKLAKAEAKKAAKKPRTRKVNAKKSVDTGVIIGDDSFMASSGHCIEER
jgi:hypothetical protein